MVDYNSAYTGVQVDAAVAAHVARGATSLLAQDCSVTPLNQTPVELTGLDQYDEIRIFIDDANPTNNVDIRFYDTVGAVYRTSGYSRTYLIAVADDYEDANQPSLVLMATGTVAMGSMKLLNTSNALLPTLLEGTYGVSGGNVTNYNGWNQTAGTEITERVRLTVAGVGTVTRGIIRVVGFKY